MRHSALLPERVPIDSSYSHTNPRDPRDVCLAEGSEVQSDEEELDQGCPPLWEFSSSADASLLEAVASRALTDVGAANG